VAKAYSISICEDSVASRSGAIPQMPSFAGLMLGKNIFKNPA
jgi:hypothetical protein